MDGSSPTPIEPAVSSAVPVAPLETKAVAAPTTDTVRAEDSKDVRQVLESSNTPEKGENLGRMAQSLETQKQTVAGSMPAPIVPGTTAAERDFQAETHAMRQKENNFFAADVEAVQSQVTNTTGKRFVPEINDEVAQRALYWKRGELERPTEKPQVEASQPKAAAQPENTPANAPAAPAASVAAKNQLDLVNAPQKLPATVTAAEQLNNDARVETPAQATAPASAPMAPPQEAAAPTVAAPSVADMVAGSEPSKVQAEQPVAAASPVPAAASRETSIGGTQPVTSPMALPQEQATPIRAAASLAAATPLSQAMPVPERQPVAAQSALPMGEPLAAVQPAARAFGNAPDRQPVAAAVPAQPEIQIPAPASLSAKQVPIAEAAAPIVAGTVAADGFGLGSAPKAAAPAVFDRAPIVAIPAKPLPTDQEFKPNSPTARLFDHPVMDMSFGMLPKTGTPQKIIDATTVDETAAESSIQRVDSIGLALKPVAPDAGDRLYKGDIEGLIPFPQQSVARQLAMAEEKTADMALASVGPRQPQPEAQSQMSAPSYKPPANNPHGMSVSFGGK